MTKPAGLITLGPLVFALALQAFPQAPAKVLWSRSSFGTSDYFQEPSDIEIDGRRSLIYVADAGSHRVLVFDFGGEFLRAIGRKGQGPGEFARPTGIGLVEDDGIAVADFG